MSGSYRCYGKAGTTDFFCTWCEDGYVAPEGYVLMVDTYPERPWPDRFGNWFVTETGHFEWVKFDDPPFNVVYHEGKLKNGDTLEEITIETLPGNIAARLHALENPEP